MYNTEMQALYQRSNIESNKQFQRLSEKTQVMMPQNGQNEVIKNRLTHSYEVATSTLMMAANIAQLNKINLSDIDFKGSLFCVAALHDLGHSAFGHDGAELLNNYFRELGVEDGFSDNNNNLVVIEKNNIVVSNYTTASVIKYPEKLYSFQKERYIPMLNSAIETDKNHFKSFGINLKDQKTTIACQIMDEADRNSYTTSDFADFLCLGGYVDLVRLHEMAKVAKIDYRYSEIKILSDIIKDNSKATIKSYFNDLKNRFNCNYNLSNKGLVVIDKELEEYREFLNKLCFEFYIYPIRKNDFHQKNMELFKQYVEDVVAGKYSPSEYYTKKIQESKTDIEKYTYMRDMIAEVSDWYVIQSHNVLKNNV